MRDDITIKGLDDFTEDEVTKIKELTLANFEKISRDIEGDLIMHAKKHNKDGNRAKYSFHAKIQTPDSLINVEGDDWLLSTAMHKVMNKLKNSVHHKLKNEQIQTSNFS